MKYLNTVPFILGLILIIASCGYHFAGTVTALPSEVKTVSIPVFTNETSEIGIESILTEAVVSEFIRNKKLRVVKGGMADSTLHGIVRSFEYVPISFDEDGVVKEYRATLILSSWLINNREGEEELWRDDYVEFQDEYAASTDVLSDEDNRRDTMRRISADLAQVVHERIVEDF